MKRFDHYRALGEYLQACRIKKGLTQKDVSEALGYSSAQFISNFERWRAVPPLSKLPKLIKILEMNSDTYIDLYMDGLYGELKEKLQPRKSKKTSGKYKTPAQHSTP